MSNVTVRLQCIDRKTGHVTLDDTHKEGDVSERGVTALQSILTPVAAFLKKPEQHNGNKIVILTTAVDGAADEGCSAVGIVTEKEMLEAQQLLVAGQADLLAAQLAK